MSRRITYGFQTCRICKRDITNAGAAYVSHMRKHVREGKALEKGRNSFGWIEFEKVETPRE